jgi:hypothetical protein
VHLDPIGGGAMVAPFMLGEMDVKAIEDLVGKATKAVKETTDRMQQALDQAINESKRIGTLTEKTADECKAASALAKTSQDELKKLSDEMKARMLEVEQKIAQRPANPAGELKSWGQIVAESENYKAAVKSKAKEMGPVEIGTFHKSPILSAGVQTVDRHGPLPGPGRARAVRARRRAAAHRPQPAPGLLDGVAADRVRARERLYQCRRAAGRRAVAGLLGRCQPRRNRRSRSRSSRSPVITLAHWIPASRQILADAKMLMSYIDQRLRYGLLFEEEREVLTSTGGANSASSTASSTRRRSITAARRPTAASTRCSRRSCR